MDLTWLLLLCIVYCVCVLCVASRPSTVLSPKKAWPSSLHGETNLHILCVCG